ncbi:putative TLC domain-containing protein [Purpureocillium lavendulum]|uniref:DNA mismatch repair protein MSH5 n=1 Tax=Purpureocillium lavendulum TaxID=1247861 RepID=A0AB34G296_9HYPO|nr:putative TLC domain-containing protein [Purpureocillium lavendulum]
MRNMLREIEPSPLVLVGDSISRTIDFEESAARQRTSVRSGIDSQLDALKRWYDGLGNFLTEVVNRLNGTLPEWARTYIRSCVFLPQLGFLTVVDLDSATGSGRYEGEGADGGLWDKLFATNETAYYKNQYMKELDAQYGDMYCEIGDREVEIIHRLAAAILAHEESLLAASDVCGEFDALLALAIGAEKYNWTAPQMTEENIVKIENGRHPLQELVVPLFVPNDCDIRWGHETSNIAGHEPRQILALTGPNHSGKSIYLKQVAIIVYLAHVGSFVPADRAVIGLTDKILTRISTRESVCRTESAFAIDLKQVAQAMQCSTPESLVLIDEFGKGTNPDDGAGLFAAMLGVFLARGSRAPKVLIATHFHEVFERHYFRERCGLVLAQMRVEACWDANQEDKQVTYLFKLGDGYSTTSFGGQCAALNGVPSAIVEHAEVISRMLSRNEDIGTALECPSPDEVQRLTLAEDVARRFIQADFGGSETAETDQAPLDVKSALLGILSTVN